MGDSRTNVVVTKHASSGAYGLAFLGAGIYYVHHAVGFVAGVWGVLKACVWPALLTYYLMDWMKI